MKQYFFVPADDYSRGCFDTTMNLTRDSSFKYLFIRETKPGAIWQILLIKIMANNPLAIALHMYMKSNHLPEIEVHGGGCIGLEKDMKRICLVGTSKSYQSVDSSEIVSTLKENFPGSDVISKGILPLKDEEKLEHKIYLLEEVAEKAQTA